MQAIIDAIGKTPDPETYYVIITDLPNNYNYAGYMPLKSQFAFLFINNFSSTTEGGGAPAGDNTGYHIIAHELGHGAFYMKHIEDEYKILDATNNLMDGFTMGKSLWKPQWDWIGDPSWRLYMFQKESEGAMKIVECGSVDKPDNIKALVTALKTCSGIDDAVAKLKDAELSNNLCAEERKDILKCIAKGLRVGPEDEQSIIRVIKTTPLGQKAKLVELIGSEPNLLANLHSSINGEELTTYYKELILLYRLSKPKDYWDNIKKTFDDNESLLRKKPTTEWAKKSMYYWLDVGFIDYLSEGRIVYTNVELTENNHLKFYSYTSAGVFGPTYELNPILGDLAPFQVIRLYFLSENEQLGVPKGEYADIPAIALRFLIQKQFNRDAWVAVNTGFVLGTLGSGSIATLWGKVDCVLGLGAILEDNYHNQLTKTPEGQAVLTAWKVLNVALLARLGYKVAVSIPTAWRSLTEAIAKLRVKNPTLATQVENEAKQAFSEYVVAEGATSKFGQRLNEIGEVLEDGLVKGKYSQRTFNPNNVGGAIQKLDWSIAKIERSGIEKIKKHLARLEKDPWNDAMVKRLEEIESGKISATVFDKRFYTHELTEFERTQKAGFSNTHTLSYEEWNDLHSAVLEDFSLNEMIIYNGNKVRSLFHPDIQK